MTDAITITQNPSFGQLYVEQDNSPDTNIRIPTQRVEAFLHEVGLNLDELPQRLGGSIAAQVWAIAEQYEG